MSRWQIYEVVTDADGVDCYIKRGEIIRCGECKHWHEKDGLTYCDRIDYGYGYKADDFCSYGERENDE